MAPVSNPLPVNLPAEAAKAEKIMRKFADPVNGLDSIIPPSILRRAKGFCFMSVAKAGFLFSARAGSGVVIAKLSDGTWSAPSAVGTAGGGFGFQAGVEVAEFFIVLNSRQAVKTFMAKGSITLGGNMSIAAGPLGRNLEGTGSLSSKGSIAAMYSYSRSKGLFGGASIEGAIIVERSDANSKAYGQNVTATQLLSGAIDPPSWSDALIRTITRLTDSQSSSYVGGSAGEYDIHDPYARMPIEGDDSDDGSFFNGRGGRSRKEREEAPTGGYAFGSSYAAGGSNGAGGFSPEREKSRISSMLGSVGRSRSGSGGSKGGSRYDAPTAGEDPFASQSSFGNYGSGGGGGGPKVGGEARFETQFSSLDDDVDDGYTRPSFPTSATAGSSPALNLSSSSSSRPKPPYSLSRENSSFGLTRSGSKGKLTKPRSGSANSAGLRERAGQMNWGAPRSGEDGRDSFDSLDDDREQYRRFGGTAEEWNGGGGGKEKKGGGGLMGRFRASTTTSASSPVSAFDPAALSSAPKQKSRLRSSTAPSSKKSPFDDDASFSRTETRDSFTSSEGGGNDSRPTLNRALSKPWDSEDESYFAPGPKIKPQQPAPYSSFSPSKPTPSALSSGARTPGGHALDLREVEADFASAMDLARNGGEAEVGSYSAGTRSRSSTVTGGGGGNRSRSGTVTAGGLGGGAGVLEEGERPAGVGKDGIGWAVALFDFPGVESTDLSFSKNDLLTILNRDDAEWWRARKGLKEGMVPRNYLEAHFE
ncbi:hypothetical protein JCM11251_007085 [Rhodosporidiobolus azoricus]